MLKNLLPICQQNLSNSISNLVKREKMFLNTKFPSLAHQKLECSVLSRSNTQSSFGAAGFALKKNNSSYYWTKCTSPSLY